MAHRRYTGALFVFAVAVAMSPDAHSWDWLTLSPLDAEAFVRFDGTERTSDSGEDLTDTEWRLGIKLGLSGYSLDPAIARYQLQLEPTWTTGEIKIGDTTDERSGDFLNYLLQAEVLQGTPGPVGFNVALLQNQYLNTGSLGSRYDSKIRDNSASANWKNDAFPMKLRIGSRSLKQTFRSTLDAPVSRRDETLNTITITGSSSKTDLLVEHQSLDDKIPERNNDYEVNIARLNHTLGWGNGSSLRSWIDYYDRTGLNPIERFTIQEKLNITHTDSVKSQATYRFNSNEQRQKTDEHFGEFLLNHSLYGNLNTTARLFGRTVSSQQLDQAEWHTGLDTLYSKSNLVFGATVSAGAGLAYRITDRDSKLGLIEVIDEAHVVPLGGSVILDQRFVLPATIIVTDATSQIVYDRGIDYEVLQLSGDLTQIQVIPGGRIEVGSTILVSYNAFALPSQEFSTTFANVRLGFSLPWMRFSHYDNRSENDLISGVGESFLVDRRDSTTSLQFTWRMAQLDAEVGFERRYNKVGDFESTIYLSRQNFGWAPKPDVSFSLNLLQQFTDSTDLETDLYNLELSMSWQPLGGLHIRPVIGAWKREDTGPAITSGFRSDKFILAGIRLRWYYRKLIFDLDYNRNRRTVDLVETNENRLWFVLSRRF